MLWLYKAAGAVGAPWLCKDTAHSVRRVFAKKQAHSVCRILCRPFVRQCVPCAGTPCFCDVVPSKLTTVSCIMFPSWWRSLANLTNGKDKSARRRPKSCKPRRLRGGRWWSNSRIVVGAHDPDHSYRPGRWARHRIVRIPVNVDQLSDVVHSNTGLSGGEFVVYYNPAAFTVASVGKGSVPNSGIGWSVSANTTTAGLINIGISNSGTNIISTNGGSLVLINFQVKSNAPSGQTMIDLGKDTIGTPGNTPVTDLVDQNFKNYTLATPPADNTSLNPSYAYSGSDPVDGSVTITTTNLPPTAVGDTYSTDSRDVLTVAAPGVLANDTDPQGNPLQAVNNTNPAHGTLAFNSNGSFTYTPNSGFYGTDSFTYQAFDNQILADSNVATVTINVTARLSIPLNLVGVPGSTVTVPVNIDNADPSGTGGLTGAALAIGYDASVFTVTNADVQVGSVTAGWTMIPNVVATGSDGEIGISLSSPSAATSTTGGSLVLITFHVNGGATSETLSPINLKLNNMPSGSTVTTDLDTLEGTNMLSLPTTLTNNPGDPGVDGSVFVAGANSATHFGVVAPALAGVSLLFPVTVTSGDLGKCRRHDLHRHRALPASTDPSANLPSDFTLNRTGRRWRARVQRSASDPGDPDRHRDRHRLEFYPRHQQSHHRGGGQRYPLRGQRPDSANRRLAL